jgi:putative NADH-flavin reductase
VKIAVIGATGNVGSRIVKEALARGHQVTGIARNPEKLPAQPNLIMKKGDAGHPQELSKLLAGQDVIISSIRFTASDPNALIAAAKQSGVKRYLVVGGAGSLEVAPGKLLVDTPEFPAMAKGEANAGLTFLNILRAEKDLDWSFLSPSAMFTQGERTGKFRLGGDQLLKDANGKSSITQEDFAIAMLDEVEHPKHSRRRFTVGY